MVRLESYTLPDNDQELRVYVGGAGMRRRLVSTSLISAGSPPQRQMETLVERVAYAKELAPSQRVPMYSQNQGGSNGG